MRPNDYRRISYRQKKTVQEDIYAARMMSAREEPSKKELRDMLAEAVRNTKAMERA